MLSSDTTLAKFRKDNPMPKYKIIRIKKPKVKGSKWTKLKNGFKQKPYGLILFLCLSLFGVSSMIILYATNSNPKTINLNLKIEDLADVKTKMNKQHDFKFNDIDQYVKNYYLQQTDLTEADLTEAILNTYGDINQFQAYDTEIFDKLGISSLNQLLNDEFTTNSWLDHYYQALITHDAVKIQTFETAWNDIYKSGIQDSTSHKKIANYYQFQFLTIVKDWVETQAQLQDEQKDAEKKDLTAGMEFVKNMQYQFLLNHKWYRLLAYSFQPTLDHNQIMAQQTYFNDLKTIAHQWLEYMVKQSYDDNKQLFWKVNGYNQQTEYKLNIKLLHYFPQNDHITSSDLAPVLQENNFFDQFNTQKKQYQIDDFWIKYNGYNKIEQRNEGTDEKPKYSWRNYYQFTFKFKNLNACININLADNNFRFINLDFDPYLKYHDVFHNYQQKRLVDLLDNKASWMILFALVT